jgi:hypothetical protein
MIGATRQKSKLDLPSKILAPQGYSFSLNALVVADSTTDANKSGIRFRFSCFPYSSRILTLRHGISACSVAD